MTVEKYVPGIILGYVLCACFTFFIILYNFSDFLENPSSNIIITPERYLQAGILIFVAMIITGFILTVGWSDVDYLDNPLITYYGYNNVCLFFDTAPSKYIMPVFGSLIAYFLVTYAVEDTKRSWRLPYISRNVKIFAQCASFLFTFAVCQFPVIFAIPPGEDMLGHTVPFLILIFSLPLIYISHYLQQEHPSRVHLAAILFYCAISATKASFTIIALATRRHLPSSIAEPIDVLWVGLAVPAPFLYPPPHDPTRHLSLRDAELRAKYIGVISSQLYILLVPFAFISTIIHMVSGLCKRLWAGLTSASPDADKRRVTKIDVEEGRICPMKRAGLYVGDIFGYLSLLRGWHSFAWPSIKKLGGSRVFATNVGLPVVACFDVKSAEALFLGRSVRESFVPLDRYGDESFKLNLYRSGDTAEKFRRLFLSLQPQQASDANFSEGLRFVRRYLVELSHRVDHKSMLSPIVADCASKCAKIFTSGMLLGGLLDDVLLANVYPMPVISLLYPYIPTWLFPQYYKMKSSVVALVDQMKELPRWPEIAQLSKQEGFAEEYIANAIMSVICLNVPGLTNAIANALFLLPLLPAQGKELLVDEDLMDSFCWELLRFTSRSFIARTAADTATAIHSSSGETYSVKGGTLLFTHLPVVMRDDKYWSQPNLFKAGRFRRSAVRAEPRQGSDNSGSNNDDVKDTTVEPLPTLVFGCPLGHMNNMDEHKNGRRCPFTFLAHPFLKAVVDMLVKDFRWRLDLTSRTAMTHLVVSSDAQSAEVLVVNFAPQNLTGGFFGEADQIPQLNLTGARFADFEEVINKT